MTTTRTDDQIVSEYKERLLADPAFQARLIANSLRSVFGYQPPANHTRYAQALAVTARMAKRDRLFVDMAKRVAIAMNPYAYPTEIAAQAAEAIAETLSKPVDDVIARTGPEPTRHSDAQRQWTLERIIAAYAFLAEIEAALVTGESATFGWVMEAIAQETGMAYQLDHPAYFPDMAAARKRLTEMFNK